MPGLLALLMIGVQDPATVFQIWHLLTFAITSLIATLVLYSTCTSIGSLTGLLLITSMLTTPIFRVQTEMVGMDMPMALFGLMGALQLVRGRLGWSAVCMTIAFLMKPSGLLYSMAAIGYLLAVFIVGSRLHPLYPRRRALLGTLLLLAYPSP